jgi:predicted DNA binding CopG/RHH family protein
MRRNKIDQDMPVGDLKKVDDFLPPPGKLAYPEETIKVTLRLSQASVDFFKLHAKKYHTKYQRMLRFLVDKYVERYS